MDTNCCGCSGKYGTADFGDYWKMNRTDFDKIMQKTWCEHCGDLPPKFCGGLGKCSWPAPNAYMENQPGLHGTDVVEAYCGGYGGCGGCRGLSACCGCRMSPFDENKMYYYKQ